MTLKQLTLYTLVVSLLTTSVMIPGGPVETRSFSDLVPVVALAFNIFITSVIVLGIVSAYGLFKNRKWAFQAVGLVGLAFVLIFFLDLAGIFPVSKDPMSPLLFVLEIIAFVQGVGMMVLSVATLKITEESEWAGGSGAMTKAVFVLMVALMIIGAFVVYFATRHALLP